MEFPRASRSGGEGLIVITRYPEPGRTKTRLIPALGADGAARLHHHLGQQTLQQVTALQAIRPLSVAVHFHGGSLQQMRAWLGSYPTYIPQGEGDLGARMTQAFAQGFQAGWERVVMIGTDCPHLQVSHLAQAFESLETADLVLGPALDGGYYLIGLGQWIPALLIGPTWGTDQVLQQTLEIATALQLAIAQLPTLADIDRPEDLVYL
ncbi:hypothetical protein DO97_12230 [Neosynechococcus sphagnicola sy1]|uniref:Glycosyltransferase n=1 Tax=Neosynechococcus sphagnicola sy1 TaxID=1497020 RepID=A0A098TMP7_9CYAN|nr:TIGR04282 family arsenosugar biosynthesis glycosyltransferase [Neosynechococcus sphagnicola]KGF72108.1 hypothetical protein DO97_12230 [Neosynechococcus sphagnicola sy1]